MREPVIINIQKLLIFIVGSLTVAFPCRAQNALDFSVNANWLEQSDTRGVGGAFHFAFADYLFELVPSGVYYRTPGDTTDTTVTWSAGLDARVNLHSVNFVRPYIGVGFVRMMQSGANDTILILSAGLNVRLGGGRKIPFMEAAYRGASEIDPWRYRAGIRLHLRGS